MTRYFVIVDGKIVAECLSTGTAGGILDFHGRGVIAEVIFEAKPKRKRSQEKGCGKFSTTYRSRHGKRGGA